jgi:hypothetical protein
LLLAELLPAAALADCAGGILSAVEASSGGLAAGEMLAAEPELLLAATRRGAWGGLPTVAGGLTAAATYDWCECCTTCRAHAARWVTVLQCLCAHCCMLS